jgi:hypothetical protein
MEKFGAGIVCTINVGENMHVLAADHLVLDEAGARRRYGITSQFVNPKL